MRLVGNHASPGLNTTPPPVDSGTPPPPPGYELIKQLGVGGMGVVYLAREHASGRLVAMKFLRSPRDKSVTQRFRTELRALAGVDHPGVVRVFASDFLRPDPYFTMEYLPGGSFAGTVPAGGLADVERAARLIATVARALHAAHDAGVIHRDVKPANILFAEDGTPKITDFGLAKRFDHDDPQTSVSAALGTPGYMAPEQASRHYGPPGATADVYGLGATLYHLVTGAAPFDGEPFEVLAHVLTSAPVPPRALRPDLPLGLEAVILKCLEKEPGLRYPTAAALADDLDRFLAGDRPLAPPLTWSLRLWRAARLRFPALVVGAILVATAVGIGVAARPRTAAAPVAPGVDLVEVTRKVLAAGRPVTLLGATGTPLHSRSLLGPVAFGESPLADRSCAFQSVEYALLELFPSPGVPRYRVELELRHIAPSVAPGPRDFIESDRVGVYFGYTALPLSDGGTAHSMFAVSFCDSDREAFLNGKPAGPKRVSFNRFIIRQTANALPRLHDEETGLLTFTPAKARPGAWRPLWIEVGPDRLLVRWADDAGKLVPLADWPRAKLVAEYAKFAGMGVHATGKRLAIPEWNPDAPFGLYAYSASLAVRNVVVTPLP